MIAMTLVLAEINIHAQTDSLLFRHNHTVSEENKGDLCLNIESLAFFKDNEFKGGRADGILAATDTVAATVGPHQT